MNSLSLMDIFLIGSWGWTKWKSWPGLGGGFAKEASGAHKRSCLFFCLSQCSAGEKCSMEITPTPLERRVHWKNQQIRGGMGILPLPLIQSPGRIGTSEPCTPSFKSWHSHVQVVWPWASNNVSKSQFLHLYNGDMDMYFARFHEN